MTIRLLATTTLLLAAGAIAQPANLKDIELRGATVLDATSVAALKAQYVGRSVDVEDLAEILRKVNELYQDQGYVTSGATLPDQTMVDGKLVINAVESSLGAINVNGEGRIADGNIIAALRRDNPGPLNVNALKASFGRLERARHIRNLRGQLVPAGAQGKSALNLTVTEAPDTFDLSVAVNNYRSPSVGSEQVVLGAVHSNLTGHGDVLGLSLNKTEGVDGGSVNYDFPLTRLNLRARVTYSRGDSVVVEVPFDDIDLASTIDVGGIALTYTFRDTATGSLSADLGYEQKTSKTSLLGRRFDFSQGSVNGASDAAIVHAALTWQMRSADQAFSARAGYRRGIDAAGATILPGNLPDGEFDLWLAQVQFVRRITRDSGSGWIFSTRLQAQHTSDVLQAFERFAVGGHDSVRGFRENRVLRDRGFEWRTGLEIPIFTGESSGTFSITPFVDFGKGTNSEPRRNEEQSVDISSAGLGFKWTGGGFELQAEWASALSGDQVGGDTLQDDGIHLGVSYVY